MSLLRDMIRDSRYVSNLYTKSLSRSSCNISKFKDDSQLRAFKEKQARMQCDDGYPVYLKNGILDIILYHTTVGTCIVGTSQCLWFLYTLSMA